MVWSRRNVRAAPVRCDWRYKRHAVRDLVRLFGKSKRVMTPSEKALLDLVRRTVRAVREVSADVHLRSMLEGADIALNELILRQNPEFLVTHYVQGRDLVWRGIELITDDRSRQPINDNAARLPAQIDRAMHSDVIGAAISSASEVLCQIVNVLSEPKRRAVEGVAAFLKAVVDWEVALYRHREVHAEAFQEHEVSPPPITQEGMLSYLQQRFPHWSGLELKSFQPVVGGFSKKTFLFEIEDKIHGRQGLVARVAPLHNFLNFDAYDLAREFRLLKYAFAKGLPVPEPILFEDDARALGAPFVISRMAPGRTIGTIKESTEPLAHELIEAIAKTIAQIHTCPLDPSDPDLALSHLPRWLVKSLSKNTTDFIADWRAETQRSQIDPSPAVERALCWLEANVPTAQGAPVLIHGDFGVHNFLVDHGRVTAVLDWEVSRAGDPAEDITNFFSGSGSLVDRGLFMQAYVAAGGQPIDEFRMRYFDVYHCLKILVAALAALRQIERWDSVGISHAVFGLRFITFTAARLNELIELAESKQEVQL